MICKAGCAHCAFGQGLRGKKANNASKTAFTIDPWSAGGDPWSNFAATSVVKKAKKEEETVADDIAEGFGLTTAGSSSVASASSGMSLSAEAAAIIAAVNGNTD